MLSKLNFESNDSVRLSGMEGEYRSLNIAFIIILLKHWLYYKLKQGYDINTLTVTVDALLIDAMPCFFVKSQLLSELKSFIFSFI
jgi:hypothetical protein